MNMLSAEKVKLHGIKDARWSVHDKITQYKGLVNMFKRERKVINADKHFEAKATSKEYTHMNKKLKAIRDELNSKMHGRDLLENVMIHHKTQRCAYRHLPTHEIIEAVTQSNYSLRKTLDHILFKRKQMSEELTDVKLKYGDMLDVLVSAKIHKIPVEIESARVSDKLTNAVILFQAAISVQNTYRDIIKILNKDSIYYDSLLNTLQLDILKQNICMINLIKLGQIAVEYLDDRRTECYNLDKAVKEARTVREADFEEAIELLKNCAIRIKAIKREDDFTANIRTNEIDDKHIMILSEIEEANKMLSGMANAVNAVYFDDIVPSILNQQKIQVKFSNLVMTVETRKKSLNDGLDKAMSIYNYYINHTNDFYHEYKDRKKQLVKQIKLTDNHRKECDRKNMWLSKKLSKLRIQLQSMESALKVVKLHQAVRFSIVEEATPYLQTDYGIIQKDPSNLIKNILMKVKLIVETPRNETPEVDELVAFRRYKSLTANMTIRKEDVMLGPVEEDEQPLEDAGVLRKIIKKQSAFIVETAKAMEFR